MDALADRYRLVFGTAEPPDDVDLTDDQSILDWLDDDMPGSPRVVVAVRAAVVRQILDDDPPEVWATARRLSGAGLDREVVLEQLGLAFHREMARVMELGVPYDPARYLTALAALPFPDDDELLAALARALDGRQGLTATELRPHLVRELERTMAARADAAGAEAPAAADTADAADAADDAPYPGDAVEVLVGTGYDAGTLVRLGGDRLVHLPSLAAGRILTHRLTALEIEQGLLVSAGRDLALFGWYEQLVLPDGQVVTTEGGVPGMRSWIGPEDWFAGYAEGDLVTVRVDDGGLLHLARVDEAATGADDEQGAMVAAVRAAHDDESSVEDLPVTFAELVARLVLDDADAFTRPLPPLTELVELAGLTTDGDQMAARTSQWERRDGLVRAFRIEEVLGDDPRRVEVAHRALAVLVDAGAGTDALRGVLRDLHADEDVFEVVLDELIAPGPGETERAAAAAAVADRLVAAAHRPAERGCAHWFAALVDERRGEVLAAEAHIAVAVGLDVPPGDLVDRAGWYAFDRGDAAAALRWWRMLEEPNADEMAMAERFAAGNAPKVGRNDPCWCGSGRKFKACHQGVVETAPLADRVAWLWCKAEAHLHRVGEEAHEDVVSLVLARATDPEDEDAVGDAALDPIVIDASLVEMGWFEDFVDQRAPLLPADEVVLAEAWVAIDRRIYEVVTASADATVLRDTRTGEEVTVAPRRDVQGMAPGTLWCARAVPDGSGFQLLGAVFAVPADRVGELSEVLATADGEELCAFVGELRAG